MKGHDQLIALELPHLVGDGLHLEECVAVDGKEIKVEPVPELFYLIHLLPLCVLQGLQFLLLLT